MRNYNGFLLRLSVKSGTHPESKPGWVSEQPESMGLQGTHKTNGLYRLIHVPRNDLVLVLRAELAKISTPAPHTDD